MILGHFHISCTCVAIDDNLITEGGGGEGGQYGFFIHPGETVRLPFKYQSFSVAHSVDSAQSEDGNEKSSQVCDKKVIKVCVAVNMLVV